MGSYWVLRMIGPCGHIHRERERVRGYINDRFVVAVANIETFWRVCINSNFDFVTGLHPQQSSVCRGRLNASTVWQSVHFIKMLYMRPQASSDHVLSHCLKKAGSFRHPPPQADHQCKGEGDNQNRHVFEQDSPVSSLGGKRLIWKLFIQPHSRTTLPPDMALLGCNRFSVVSLVFPTWFLVRSDVP